jgi:hypothetical protein
MRVLFCEFAAGLGKRKNRQPLAPENVSPRAVRSTRRGQPAVMTFSPAAQARTR